VKPRSVIQLSDFGGPYKGNFVTSLLALGDFLQEKGLRQVLVFSDEAADRAWLPEVREKSPVYILPRDASLFFLAKQIARIAESENAVILHTHFTTFDVPAGLAAARMRAGGKRPNVIWHLHSAFPVKSSLSRRVKDDLKLRLMGRFVDLIAVSEDLRRSAVRRGFAGRSRVVANGVDLIRATSPGKSRAQVREELGVSDDTALLLAFGWDPLTKGIDLLLEAGEMLADAGGFVLLVVGETQLREFVRNKFGDSLPAWLRVGSPRECAAELYAAADLFVSASRWEGFPYSVVEAMGNRLPVVSSNIIALDWTGTSGSVVFFEAGDAVDLARAVREVAGWSTEERGKRISASRRLVEDKYSITHWVSETYQIYRDLLADES